MTAEWARKSIMATLDEIRTGQRILGIACEADELAEAKEIIRRIEARLAAAKAKEAAC